MKLALYGCLEFEITRNNLCDSTVHKEFLVKRHSIPQVLQLIKNWKWLMILYAMHDAVLLDTWNAHIIRTSHFLNIKGICYLVQYEIHLLAFSLKFRSESNVPFLDLTGPMHKKNVNCHSSIEFNDGQWSSEFWIKAACYKRASSTEGYWDMAFWLCCLGL